MAVESQKPRRRMTSVPKSTDVEQRHAKDTSVEVGPASRVDRRPDETCVGQQDPRRKEQCQENTCVEYTPASSKTGSEE